MADASNFTWFPILLLLTFLPGCTCSNVIIHKDTRILELCMNCLNEMRIQKEVETLLMKNLSREVGTSSVMVGTPPSFSKFFPAARLAIHTISLLPYLSETLPEAQRTQKLTS